MLAHPFGRPDDLDTTVSSQQLAQQMDGCDPLACVRYSHSPSVHMYFALRNRLESCPAAWLKEFVLLDGLDSLLDSLGHMTGPSQSGFSDAILQMDCLSCVRAVINSSVGIEALVTSGDGVRKLVRGMDIVNTLARKQVLELCSAVCVYSQVAYRRLMEALEMHKRDNHLYHKFSLVVNELKMAETVPHKTAVLTFINCVLAGAKDQGHRMRLRSQFIGLGLLDVLSFLQREDTDESLYIQLQKFQEKKHEDEATSDLLSGLDLSSPQDLTDAIQTKVFGGPKMVCFVNILQDLLALETLEKEKRDRIWQLLDQQVRHIVHGLDDPDALLAQPDETACQVLSSFLAENQGASLRSSKGRESTDTESTKSRAHRTSSISKKGDGVQALKTSADSGFDFDDKLSPPPFSVPYRSEQSRKLINKISNSDLDSEDKENDKDYDTQDSNASAEELTTTITLEKKSRQVSTYDNMSPVKFPLKSRDLNCDNKASILNDLNLNDEPHMKVLFTKSLNTLPLENLKLSELESKFNFNVNMNIGSCVVEPIKPEMRFSEPIINSEFRSSEPIIKSGLRYSEPINQELRFSKNSYGIMCGKPGSFINYDKYPLAAPDGRVRRLKVVKLDSVAIENRPTCLWSIVDPSHLKLQLDFGCVEEAFRDTGSQDNTEVALLSASMRLNINLFLNRLEEEPSGLVRRLVRVDSPPLCLAFIRHLMDILPEPEEVQQLKQYNGNLLDLGPAEQFVLHLSDLPDYQTLLVGQLRRSEVQGLVTQLRSVLTSGLEGCRMVLGHEGLREVLVTVMRMANFLNHDQYNGQACGLKLSSLARLADLKCQEAGHHFVHYLARLVDAGDEQILSFVNHIPTLDKAVSCSPSEMKADFDKINTQINAFVAQLALASTVIQSSFASFLEDVKTDLRLLRDQLSELRKLSLQLRDFFCEGEGFQLQACLKTLLAFFREVRTCRMEVQILTRQKTEASKHCHMFSQQINAKTMALKFGQEACASSSVLEDKRQIVESIITELHRGHYSPPSSPSTPPPTSGDQVDPLTAAATAIAAAEAAIRPNIVVNAAPRSGTTTPDRDLHPMELSRISLVGTPVLNRPCSEMMDDDLTMSVMRVGGGRPITSSVKHLPGMVAPYVQPSVFALPQLKRVATQSTRGHHRSRSDLANSSSVTGKWIRYQDQVQRETAAFKAPLARPESSMTLATLNLEVGGYRHHINPLTPVALMPGPTLACPPEEVLEMPAEFIRSSRKGKSALTNFINRISKRVLKPRNSDSSAKGSIGDDDKGAMGGKASSAGRTPAKPGKGRGSSSDDKENMVFVTPAPAEVKGSDVNPFERSKKNPIRLSARFKNKILK